MPFLLVVVFLLALLLCHTDAHAEKKPRAQESEAPAKFTGRSVEEFVTSAWHGDAEAVDLYLKAGINPNVTDGNKRTALWAASVQGHTKIVQALLAKGASVTKTDFTGRDAAGWAAESHRPAVVQAIKRAQSAKRS